MGMLAHMELRHLRYFVTVAEEQNITRAAAKLHISQPPLSRQIRDLEAELGVALLERGARAVRLTEAGRVFIEEARAVIQRVDEACRVVRAVAAGVKGELVVGYAPSPTVEILPKALRAFQASLPGVRVGLRDLTSGEMVSALKEGIIHLALMVRPAARALRGLHFETLRKYRNGVVMAPDHPLARMKTIAVQDIASEKLLTYSLKDYPDYHDYLETLLGRAGADLKIAEECDGAMSLIAAVEGGRGIALAAETLCVLAGTRLKFVPLVSDPAPLVVGIAHRTATPSPLTRQFMETVRQVARTL